MKLGNKFLFTQRYFFFFFSILAQEKITSSPLLNLDNIKPSFEEPDNSKENDY